jgi:hypothetical protein
MDGTDPGTGEAVKEHTQTGYDSEAEAAIGAQINPVRRATDGVLMDSGWRA